MKHILTFGATVLGSSFLFAGKAAAQDTGVIGPPSERIWFNWLWLLPLMTLALLFLFPQEGLGDGGDDDETDQLVGTKGGQSSPSEENETSDDESSEDEQ